MAAGAIFALWLPAAAARECAWPGGEPAAALHVTLAYLGEAAALDATARHTLAGIGRRVAAETPPVVFMARRLACFPPSPQSDGQEVLYARVDGSAVWALRARLERALEAAGRPLDRTFPFNPHITLAYQAAGAGTPVPLLPTGIMRSNTLTLALAGERQTFAFGGRAARPLAKAQPAPDPDDAPDDATGDAAGAVSGLWHHGRINPRAAARLARYLREPGEPADPLPALLRALVKRHGPWMKGTGHDQAAAFVQEHVLAPWEAGGRAPALQLAAMAAFGLPEGGVQLPVPAEELPAWQAMQEQLGGGLAMFLRAQHAHTQRDLARGGWKHVTAYRPLHARDDDPYRPDWDRTHAPRLGEARLIAGLRTQPLSWWTADREVADRHATALHHPADRRYVLAVHVPAARVLATARTSPLVHRAHAPLLLLGGGGEARVERIG